MGTQFKKATCKACRFNTAMRPGANHLMHLVLSVLTGGLWLPVWLLCAIRFGGWTCVQCGRKA